MFDRSLNELAAAGVHVLFGEGGFQPHPPRTDNTVIDTPWHLVLDAIQDALTR